MGASDEVLLLRCAHLQACCTTLLFQCCKHQHILPYQGQCCLGTCGTCAAWSHRPRRGT